MCRCSIIKVIHPASWGLSVWVTLLFFMGAIWTELLGWGRTQWGLNNLAGKLKSRLHSARSIMGPFVHKRKLFQQRGWLHPPLSFFLQQAGAQTPFQMAFFKIETAQSPIAVRAWGGHILPSSTDDLMHMSQCCTVSLLTNPCCRAIRFLLKSQTTSLRGPDSFH